MSTKSRAMGHSLASSLRSGIVGMCAIFVVLSAQLAWSAGDAAAGNSRYGVCAACHGVKGEGNKGLNGPRLAGQEDWYLKRQLENYKTGVRGTTSGDLYGAQMRPMAMTLPDEKAIEDLVAYIGTLNPPASPATVDGDAARGKSKYTVCIACHGANGEGNASMNAPKLAGQSDWYTLRQLQNYKKGIRGTHAKDTYGRQMRPMAMTLPDDQSMKDVVAYINTLSPPEAP